VGYLDTLREIQDIDLDLYEFLNALDKINISKSAISYLATMSIRIWYMHKLLKETGSFYLHCDPTMSHYLKVVCDLIFGSRNFRSEIVWHRSFGFKRKTAKKFPQKNDTILFYAQGEKYKFNVQYIPHKPEYLKRFKPDETGRLCRTDVNPTKGGTRKIYLDEIEGDIIDSVWIDINPINPVAKERLGYPTQKPETLLERIIEASSNKGDVVADFFCGCGTAISVAQKLKRKWLGVDISHLAVKLITKRLMDAYGIGVRKTFEIFGFPQDIASANELATATKKGRLKFEEWIIEVMLHGVLNEKKNQTGFDGYLTLDMPWKKEFVLIEVKSGNASLQQVNHFIQTIKEREAVMGLFVCFAEQVTDGMVQSAKKQGCYLEQNFGRKFEKLQIITVEDLLEHKLPNFPPAENITFKKAVKSKEKDLEQEIEM